jgi:hypothetical protein
MKLAGARLRWAWVVGAIVLVIAGLAIGGWQGSLPADQQPAVCKADLTSPACYSAMQQATGNGWRSIASPLLIGLGLILPVVGLSRPRRRPDAPSAAAADPAPAQEKPKSRLVPGATGLALVVTVILAVIWLRSLAHRPSTYDSDGGAVGANRVTTHPDWKPKVDLATAGYDTWTGWYHDVDAVLERALPFATDDGREVDWHAMAKGGPQVLWCPYGKPATLLPPNPRGGRLFCVDLLFPPDAATAPVLISFVDANVGDQLRSSRYNSFTSSPPPGGIPPDYLYTLRPSDAHAVLCAIFTGRTDSGR